MLFDKDDEMFYVGQTTDREKRLKDHKEKYGNDIRMSILKTTVEPWANYYEALYINFYLKGGAPLKNKTIYKKMPPAPKITEEEYLKLIQTKKYAKEQKVVEATKEAVARVKEENQRIVELNRELNVELCRMEVTISELEYEVYKYRNPDCFYIKGYNKDRKPIFGFTYPKFDQAPKKRYKTKEINIDEAKILKDKLREFQKHQKRLKQHENVNEITDVPPPRI